MAHDVFISYARLTGTEYAVAIRDQLKGVKTFLDVSNLDVGELFTSTLAEAILDARVIVIIADETYFTRWYCLRELRTALGPYHQVVRKPERDADALQNALRSLVVLRARESLEALPQRLALTNWPTPAELGRLVGLVEERLSSGVPTIRSQLEATHALDLLTGFHEAAALPPPNDSAALIRYKLSPLDLSLGERFVGRAEDIERLHHSLYPRERGNATDALATVRLVGTEGFGKTTLLVEYVRRYSHYYPAGVFWIDARSSESALEEQLYGILKELRPTVQDLPALRAQKEDVHSLLAEACRRNEGGVQRCLFVVDNIPEQSPPRPLLAYCPAVGSATVIAASAQMTLERGVTVLELSALAHDPALVMLTKGLARAGELETAQWNDLSEWVGRMPLALEQMHWALETSAIAPAALLELARQERSASAELDELVDVLMGALPAQLHRPVSSLFRASVEALDSETRVAARVLAQLAPSAIPEALIDALGLTPRVRLQLRTRRFVNAGTNAVFGSMPRLLADYLARTDGSQDESWLRACNAVLQVMTPAHVANADSWRLMSLCEPHAQQLFRSGTRGGELLENTPKQQQAIEVGLRAADLLRARGDVVRADTLIAPLYGTALTLLSNPRLELRVAYSYARTREELGKWDDALSALRLIEFAQDVIGRDDPLVLSSRLMMMRVLVAKRDFPRAVKVLDGLLADRETYASVGAKFPIDDVRFDEELATFLWRTERYAKAADVFRRVLDARKSEPPDSQDVLRAQQNYARALAMVGGNENLARANELLSAVQRTMRDKYGPGHRGTIIVTSNLASARRSLGDAVAAIALFREALDNARTSLGEDHDDTVTIRRELARTYIENRDSANARSVLLEISATEERRGLPDLELTRHLLGTLKD